MRRRLGVPMAVVGAMLVLATIVAGGAGGASGADDKDAAGIPRSGVVEFSDDHFGTRLTECPQAGLTDRDPPPLDRRQIDQAERISNDAGDDVRANQDYSCFPQNEPGIDSNPRNNNNIVGGGNDYRTLSHAGFYSTTNGGKTWYDGLLPPPSVPNGDIFDASGDPVIAFDRAGIVYFATINFNRTDDTNGISVHRSTNGGFTWSRPCVPLPPTPTLPPRCGGVGDPRQPGDGIVTFFFDEPEEPEIPPFDDKEWLAAGPRPAGVSPVCFDPISHAPRPCDPDVVGVDRLHVTWTRFEDDPSATFEFTARVLHSYSDDQARSWSPPQAISGSADFCVGTTGPTDCDLNQFSVPAVSPRTGAVYVSFQNFSTPDENQYLLVRSTDGGQTWEEPSFITPVFDVNFPLAGFTRPDCTDRGQQAGRIVYTNSCFRSNAGGNVVVDRRGRNFADDLYFVMSDNRNGTAFSSNSDVFFFKSVDGGESWVGPTRVNDDRSAAPANRDCGRAGQPACPTNVHTGNDQWWPWVDVGDRGELNIVFHDRRLDTESVAHEWPSSRQRPGNYLVWHWGAQCRVTRSVATPGRQCVARQAEVIEQPAEPMDPGPDPVPGQNQRQSPYRNFQISDLGTNFDYSFRAGIFAGDYNNVAVGYRAARGGDDEEAEEEEEEAEGEEAAEEGGPLAYTIWTDARNGRSSRNQQGRNPACEQSDFFFDSFNARRGGRGGEAGNITPFLVTPCPAAAVEKQDERAGG
jgi:hypothetical protein